MCIEVCSSWKNCFYFSLFLIRENEEEIGIPQSQVKILGIGNDALSITNLSGISFLYGCMEFPIKFLQNYFSNTSDWIFGQS